MNSSATVSLRQRLQLGWRFWGSSCPGLFRHVNHKRPPLRFQRQDGQLKSVTVTTPLFYANGLPHMGNAYPTIAADVMARYARMRGAEVHFVTGMDEHGEKISRTAGTRGVKPGELVDGIAREFQDMWERLDVKPDHFARTTCPSHRKLVEEMWQRCQENGDIYRKEYEGYYCVGCESYLDADEMGSKQTCKIHLKPCELRREENYFFRLSKYWDQVASHVQNNSDFILPVSRRNEVLALLKDSNKRDLSISRASTSWGIPVPGDASQVVYVWFDALLGYLSSLIGKGQTPSLDTSLRYGWPADVHVVGKDILRFHAIYWPAMLMSAGLPLPKHIVSHGFLTKDGLKMGKSLGNVLEPGPLVERFGSDAVRFYFASCLSFGEDVDFSSETFATRVNASLANELGNLTQRLLSLCRKHLQEPLAPDDAFDELSLRSHPVYIAATRAPADVETHYERFDFARAASAALEIAVVANIHIMSVKPWALLKDGCPEEDKREALRQLVLMAEAVRICTVLLSPIIPGVSAKAAMAFSGSAAIPSISWEQTNWAGHRALDGLKMGFPKPMPLFPRIDPKTAAMI